MKRTLLLSSILLLSTFGLYAQGSITTDGGNVFIDFDNTTTGILSGPFDASDIISNPAAGDLDADGVHIEDDDADIDNAAATFGTNDVEFRGTSSGGTGASGVYAFDVGGGNITFGIQPAGARWADPADEGHVIFRIDNNSGVTFTAFRVSYDLYELNNEGRNTTVEAYLTADESTPNYGSAQATFTTTEASVPGATFQLVQSPMFDVTGFNVPNGESVFLRFKVFDGSAPSGSRDEIAIDNIRIIGASVPALLPVELLSFKANQKENQVQLEWTTASETNNEGFEIEKSSNGKAWKAIDFVKGAGTTLAQQNYSFIDESPLAGINYYRLKQLDFDGAYEYSEVVAVDMQQNKQLVRLQSNLVQEQLMILTADKAELKIVNAMGVSVQQSTIRGNSTIDVSQLATGTYNLLVTVGGKTEVLRFVKL